MRKNFVLFILCFLLTKLYAQKTAAVTFTSSWVFTDSLGKETSERNVATDFCYADAIREIRLLRGVGKKKSFDNYQKANYRHHTELWDSDSNAVYHLSNYYKTAKGLHKSPIIKNSDWKIIDSTVIILGYKCKIAVRIDDVGVIQRVYFTDQLSNYRIRYGLHNIPGFVLRYERVKNLIKAKGMDVMEATDIDFYDDFIKFPTNYSIF